jgi:hypothetical protein
MTDLKERKRVEFAIWAKLQGLKGQRELSESADFADNNTYWAEKAWQAARREELSRTREYLRKLAWSEADIMAWENWHGE